MLISKVSLLVFEIFYNFAVEDRLLLRISAIETRFIALDLASVAKQKLCTFAIANMNFSANREQKSLLLCRGAA